MKKLFSLLISTFVLAAAQAAHAATCTLNGEEVPCDDMPGWVLLIPLAIFALMILMIVFWIMMLVDAVKREEGDQQIIWIIVIALTGVIGAIIYYFVRKRPRKKEMQQPNTNNVAK